MPLWNNLSMHVYRKTANRIGFNVCNIILGETPLSSGNRIVIFFNTIYKTIHIYFSETRQIPNFTGLMYHLKFKNEIEKSIFIQNFEILKISEPLVIMLIFDF